MHLPVCPSSGLPSLTPSYVFHLIHKFLLGGVSQTSFRACGCNFFMQALSLLQLFNFSQALFGQRRLAYKEYLSEFSLCTTAFSLPSL